MWGNTETQYFFHLTPDRILDAVECLGLRCTGRCLTLNSMENRVYELELEMEENDYLYRPTEKFRIVKFYRPGRWTQAQILEEHQYLRALKDAEISVVAPIAFSDGGTLHKMPAVDIWYAIFPKVGGRSPDEWDDEKLARIGRLVARMHAVGAASLASHRLKLDVETYGLANLKFLLDARAIPESLETRYRDCVETICKISAPWFSEVSTQRIHGDCHFGNVLWGEEGPFFVDFDDMVRGPCVQDVWLLIPGRDTESNIQREVFLEAYEQWWPFDRKSLRLIEPLRALRFIHFSAWMAKRWADPAFPRAFPHFGTSHYWEGQVGDLEEQLERIVRESI